MFTRSLFLIFLIIPNFLISQIPRTLSFQGVLTDNEKQLLPDDNYTLTLRFYTEAIDGEPLWEESIQVELENGIFQTLIGATKDLNLVFDQPYWIGIAIDGGEEMFPRTPLTASPYSLGGTATDLELKNTGQFHDGFIINGSDTSIFLVPVDGGMYFGPDSMANGLRNSPNVRALTINEIRAELTNLSVRQLHAADLKGPAIVADADLGIFAIGDKLSAVLGISHMGHAISGQSLSNIKAGVFGTNKGFAGIYGESEFGRGVLGISTENTGVKGEGPVFGVEAIGSGFAGVGLRSEGASFGIISSGNTGAAKFNGTVFIEEMGQLKIDQINSEDSDKLLVWGDNKFVKTRSLSQALADLNPGAAFNGCLNNLDFKVQSEGVDFFRVGQNKMAELKGFLTVKDDDGSSGIYAEGPGVTLAPTIGAVSTSGSTDATAISGIAFSGIGVYGMGKIGCYFDGSESAGIFTGNVLIEDMGQLKIDRIDEEKVDQILVWGDNRYVKRRSLSEAIQDLLPGDNDTDPENEIQMLDKHGSQISLSKNGGFVDLKDDDAENELQKMTKENNSILLNKNGGSIELLDDDPENELFNGKLNEQEFSVSFGGTDAFVVDNESRVGVEGVFGVYAPSTSAFPAITGIGNSATIPPLFIQNQNPVGPAVNIIGPTYIGNGTNSIIVFDPNPGASNAAQIFGNQFVQGNIEATGTITGSGKSFLIDHPLDPEKKQLRHFSVESDQLTNIYKGNATLNSEGEAWVTMPEWFEALNTDFTYQLTCIGGFAQVYIAEEIQDLQFKIAGGKPGLKVSWEVSGVRHDRSAREIDQTIEIVKK